MEEGARPSSTELHHTPRTHTPRVFFNPYALLEKTKQYGEALWDKIQSIRGTAANTTPLLNLSLIIEEQLQNISDLCRISSIPQPPSTAIDALLHFYSRPELLNKHTKYTDEPLVIQLLTQPTYKNIPTSYHNYYSILSLATDTKMEADQGSINNSAESVKMKSQPDAIKQKSFFVEDLTVSEVSDIVFESIQRDRIALETEEGVSATSQLAPTTTNLSLEVPVSQHLRINLIRHRHARTTDMTTLKLFKSLLHTLRLVDKNISIMPYDSKKQQYTAIVSNKQIDTLNDNQLRLYFQPWHREQYYSLSGFIHLCSFMSYDELVSQPPLVEWLDTYQYSTKKCSSQSEEMTIIGALCYGSTWIYREDLKLHIMKHPEWTKQDTDPNNPLVFDLLLRTFRGIKKSTPMIFVSTERSKQETVREIFKIIYDGTAKTYPRGEMMLFFPTRNGDQYTPEQRERIIFNHETYLGEEEVTAIHGLQNLNTEITLKGGKTTTIRTLLKSLPATDGMSRNRLFQLADPNAGQTCTIVTFQKNDRLFIDQRKASIEQELRSVLAQGEASKLFTDEVEGIWFGGHARKRNGKPIALSIPHKADLEYIKHTESLLNTQPKKRNHSEQQEHVHPPTQITYRGMVQAQHTQTTQSISIHDPEGTTTTTTTQTSQTVTATMEARFQYIETEMKNQKEQQIGMDNRLVQLENRTMTIDDNIAAMMAHWRITPTNKRKADNELNSAQHTQGGEAGMAHTASTQDMDLGDSDECF